MAATQAFLKETVLNSKNPKPGIVKVVRHVDGPLDDGSLIREVADRAVYIKAIFTPQSQNTYQQSYEDSYNSQPDWDHALLLLNQYRVECQPSCTAANRDKRPRFVLVVERFGLCNIHEGFYSKNQPQDIMSDKEVQAKAYEVEKHLCSSSRSATVKGQEQSSQNVDLSLSLLLDQLGEASLPHSATASQSQGGQQRHTDDAGIRDRGGIRYTRQSAIEAMRRLNVEDFIVSSDQEALLNSIPEWKVDYTVPGPESVPEQLTPCDLASPPSSDPPDFAPEGPTLRSEGGPGPSSAPSTTSQSTSAKAAVGAKTAAPVAATSQAGQNLMGNQAAKVVAGKQLEDCNNLATLTPSHNNLLLLVVTAESESGAVEEDVDTKKMTRVGGEPDTISAPAQDKVAAELAADTSGASESSVDSQPHHPDVSFSISSASNGEEMISDNPIAPPVSTATDVVHSVGAHNQNSTRNKGSDVAVTEIREDQRQREVGMPCSSGQVMPRKKGDLSTATPPGLSDRLSVAGSATSTSNQTDAQGPECGTGSRPAPVPDRSNPRSREAGAGSSSTAPRSAGQCNRGRAEKDSDSGVGVDWPSAGRNRAGEGSSVRKNCAVGGVRTSREANPRSQFKSLAAGISTQHATDGQQASQSCCSVHFSETTPQFTAERTADSDSQQLPSTMEFTVQESQGFKPSDLLTEDLVPDASYSVVHKNSAGACDGDTAEQHGTDAEHGMHLLQNRGPGGLSERSSSDRRDETSQKWTGNGGQQAAGHTDTISQAGRCLIRSTAKGLDGQRLPVSADLTENTPEYLVYYSTQNPSSGESQSQPLCLSLSPIQCHSNHPDERPQTSILEMDNEEHARLLALEQDHREEESSQSTQPAARSPEALPTGGLEMASFLEGADGISQASQECTNTSRVLVDYTESDDGTDESYGSDLILLIARQRTKATHAEAQTVSSSETVVVPDSSQEDVIVLSSSSGSSTGDMSDKHLESEAHTVGELCGQTKNAGPSRTGSAHSVLRSILEAADISRQTDKANTLEPASKDHPVHAVSHLSADHAALGNDLCQDTQNRKRKSTGTLLEGGGKKKRGSDQTPDTGLDRPKENKQVQRHCQSTSGISANTDISSKGSKNNGPINLPAASAESDTSEEELEASERTSSMSERVRGLQDIGAIPPEKQSRRRLDSTSSHASTDSVTHRSEVARHDAAGVRQPGSLGCSNSSSDTNPNHSTTNDTCSPHKNSRLRQLVASLLTRLEQTSVGSQATLHSQATLRHTGEEQADKSQPPSNQPATSSQQTEASEKDIWLCSSRLTKRKRPGPTRAPQSLWRAGRVQTDSDRLCSGRNRCGQTEENRTSLPKSPQKQTADYEQRLGTRPAAGASRNRHMQQLPSAEGTDSTSDEVEENVTGRGRSRHTKSARTVTSVIAGTSSQGPTAAARSVTAQVTRKRSQEKRANKDRSPSPGARQDSGVLTSNPSIDRSSKRTDPLVRASAHTTQKNAGLTRDNLDCARPVEASSAGLPGRSSAGTAASATDQTAGTSSQRPTVAAHSVTARVTRKRSRDKQANKDRSPSPGAGQDSGVLTSNPSIDRSSKRTDPLVRASAHTTQKNAGLTRDSLDCARPVEASPAGQPGSSAGTTASAADRRAATSRHEGICSKGSAPSRIADQAITPAPQEENSHSETNSPEIDMDSIQERIKRNLGDWLMHRARSRDPQQRRLRQLKLTADLLKKVEECLGQDCT